MFSADVLQEYKDKGLIKSSTRDDYTVWCYTVGAVYSHTWDEVTMSCRGLVYADDGSLVSRPFRKFFNWDQTEAVIEQGPFVAYDKMDGTLIVVGEHNGQAVVSTKGSFDTWHSETARELLLGFVPEPGYTVMFELIHPENRIVVDYGDFTGLIFLGAVHNETGAERHPEEAAGAMAWHGEVVVQRAFNFHSMTQTIQNPESGENREGFVVVWPRPDGPPNRVKLKFAQYVALHGVMTGLTNRRVWEHMVAGTMIDLFEIAPDELHDDIKKVQEEIQHLVTLRFDEARDVGGSALELYPNDRKSAAHFIQTHTYKELWGMSFKCYDEKYETAAAQALQLARPEVSRPVGASGLS